MDAAVTTPRELLRTLPGDDVRQILWRFADRFDLQMVVQSTRSVARGPVGLREITTYKWIVLGNGHTRPA